MVFVILDLGFVLGTQGAAGVRKVRTPYSITVSPEGDFILIILRTSERKGNFAERFGENKVKVERN